jgi:hypothetical protein
MHHRIKNLNGILKKHFHFPVRALQGFSNCFASFLELFFFASTYPLSALVPILVCRRILSRTFLLTVKIIDRSTATDNFSIVAGPGCLSRILIFTFRVPDPGVKKALEPRFESATLN